MPISFVVLTIAMAPIIFMYFQTVYYSDRIIKGNISDEYNKYMKLFVTVMIFLRRRKIQPRKVLIAMVAVLIVAIVVVVRTRIQN